MKVDQKQLNGYCDDFLLLEHLIWSVFDGNLKYPEQLFDDF